MRHACLGLAFLAACAPAEDNAAPPPPGTRAETAPRAANGHPPPGEEAPLSSVSVVQIERDVWLHASEKFVAPYGLIVTHGLVVADEDGVWLIDTAWTDEQTERLLRLAEAATGRQVTHAVATHAHDDKIGGMAALREAGVDTYALDMTNEAATGRGLSPAEADLSANPDGTVPLPDGTPGGIEVFYPGPGHTPDNVVVAVPNAGVLFGGCLIRPGASRSLGNTDDADIDAWASSVRAAAARYPDARIVVPSHGAPSGRSLLDHTIVLAEAARAQTP